MIFIELLLPPILFVWPLLAGLRMRLGTRRRRMLMAFGLGGLLLTSLPVVPSLLFLGLESGLAFQPVPRDAVNPPAAIVVLGGTFSNGRDAGGLTPGVQPGALSLQRIRAGAALQRLTGLPILVTGGGADAAPSIGQLMAETYETDLHITPRWVERAAADTWENATRSAEMLHADGINSVYLVTNAWHMRRALIAFRHAGLTAWPAPDTRQKRPGLVATDFMPSASAWLNSYYAFHEIIGCIAYALRH